MPCSKVFETSKLDGIKFRVDYDFSHQGGFLMSRDQKGVTRNWKVLS